MVVVSIVLVLPAMPVVFVMPVSLRLIMVGSVMMRLVLMRFFRPLHRRSILLLWLLRGLWIRISRPGRLARRVFVLRVNRGHPAAAKQAEAAR